MIFDAVSVCICMLGTTSGLYILVNNYLWIYLYAKFELSQKILQVRTDLEEKKNFRQSSGQSRCWL